MELYPLSFGGASGSEKKAVTHMEERGLGDVLGGTQILPKTTVS